MFVIESCCSAQNSSRGHPLSLQFAIACHPRTPLLATASQPPLALRSPGMTILSFAGMFVRSFQRSVFKLSFFCRICLESRSLNTEECDMLLVMKWEAHGNDGVRVSCWLIYEFGGNWFLDHETNTWGASLRFWFSRPIQRVACTKFF